MTLLYIGQQGSPDEGSVLDIRAVDDTGDVVIVELECGNSPLDIGWSADSLASALYLVDRLMLHPRSRKHGLWPVYAALRLKRGPKGSL